jgi:hypothetical protein
VLKQDNPMVDEEQPFEGKGLKTAEQALAFGGAIFERSEDFDVAIDHVLTLLTDAVVLFERQSFGSAAFLAITADLFGILAVGYRPGIAAGQLDCRLRGPGRFRDFVLWPCCKGRANDAGNLWR